MRLIDADSLADDLWEYHCSRCADKPGKCVECVIYNVLETIVCRPTMRQNFCLLNVESVGDESEAN